MGPEAITETLLGEGLLAPAIEYAIQQLALSSNINDPLRYARKIAETHKPPSRQMGCSACIDGWLVNMDSDPSRYDPAYPIFFFDDRTETDFVRACHTCRPHKEGTACPSTTRA